MKTLLKLIDKNKESIISKMPSYGESFSEDQHIKDIWGDTIDGLKTVVSIADKNETDSFYKIIESVGDNRDLFFVNIGASKSFNDGSKYGISLALLKYQKYCLMESIEKAFLSYRKKIKYLKFVQLYFDRMEMKLAGECTCLNENELIQAQRDKIHTLKHTIGFMKDVMSETSRPYILLDKSLKILTANESFIELIVSHCLPGYYYLEALTCSNTKCYPSLIEKIRNDNVEKLIPWITEDLYSFYKSDNEEVEQTKLIESAAGMMLINTVFKKMPRHNEMICITFIAGADLKQNNE